jgi:predicted DCC family thiol-disulfide oxidoreductase YuxK
MQAITVLYDGSCPICIKEMHQYQRFEKSGEVNWFDITGQDEWLLARQIDPDAALLELHVLTPEGKLVKGVDAFILLWQRAPLLRPIAWIASLPLLKSFIKNSYGWFTRRRLEKDGRLPGRSCKKPK